MSRVVLAKLVDFVQLADDRIVEVLVGVKTHRHHAAIAVAGEDDCVAGLHVVGDLSKLVAEVGNRPDVHVHCWYRSHWQTLVAS